MLVLCSEPSEAESPSPETIRKNEQDFDTMWSEIGSSYAYFDRKSTDWDKVKTLYRPRLKEISTREEFIGLLEKVLEELYDPHAHLNTNTAASPKLIPSGTDLWVEWNGDKAIITEVRSGSPAERAGLKAGLEVFGIDGAEVRDVVDRRIPQSLRRPDPAARDWALRAVLAGPRGESRRIVAQTGRTRGEFVLEDPMAAAKDEGTLHYHRLAPDEAAIGYIRVHNSLGSMDLLRDFDAALKQLEGTAGLILDLRDTPSGGNTTVARGLMGRFLEREGFYQKHSLPEEERTSGVKRSWMEVVSPRGDLPYKAPVVVLVDHWTGSMGEGIAIGMDGLKRATIVGTKMAGLLGATHQITLPNSGIGVNVPAEKLFHVNGTPREDYVPAVVVDLKKPENQKARDPILDAGLEVMRSLQKKASK
ncbi:MAG TPA: S41 family peptidase [Candidatus Eisenbacteria bacterium]|nr:S41 family peptidase [Candidatus Eisenbacteria bacterium]